MRTADERTALVVAVEPDLRRLARKWAGVLGPSHLDDAFQVAWLAAWKAARSFDAAKGTKLFFVWAYRPVKWAVLNLVRREMGHRSGVVGRHTALRGWDDAPEAAPCLARDDREAGRAEVAEWVRWAVAQLGYTDRGVVEMRYGLGDRHEYRQDDCGAVFGVTGQAAGQREARALAALRDLLEETW